MFTFAWRARPSGGNSHFFYDGPKKCKKINNFMKSKKIPKNPMFFHARNTNMETTQLSHSSSESLKSATMIQLFPQKSLFSIKSLVQCLAREGVGRFCGIGHFFIPIREPCVLSIPSGGIFPHFLDIYFWSGILFGCQKTQN